MYFIRAVANTEKQILGNLLKGIRTTVRKNHGEQRTLFSLHDGRGCAFELSSSSKEAESTALNYPEFVYIISSAVVL